MKFTMVSGFAVAVATAVTVPVHATDGAGQVHDTMLATGVIESHLNVDAKRGSTGAYYPGQGGAIGGALAFLWSVATARPNYTTYRIRLANGDMDLVALDVATFNDGDCVDIMVAKEHPIRDYFNLGEATLVASSACPTKSVSADAAVPQPVASGAAPAASDPGK